MNSAATNALSRETVCSDRESAAQRAGRANGPFYSSPGQRPGFRRVLEWRAESPLQIAGYSRIAEGSGIQPSNFFLLADPGRWPGLGWVGPLAQSKGDVVSCMSGQPLWKGGSVA
jgi:hypothetical protein